MGGGSYNRGSAKVTTLVVGNDGVTYKFFFLKLKGINNMLYERI